MLCHSGLSVQARGRDAGILARLAARAAAGRARESTPEGRPARAYCHERGFTLSQPVTRAPARPRQRVRVAYEQSQRRRLDSRAALVNGGAAPPPNRASKPAGFAAGEAGGFLQALPTMLVAPVVLGNAGIHCSRAIRAALPALWA